MNLSDSDFIEKAFQQAQHAEAKDEVPVGVVIVKDNQVISTGYNCVEHTKQATKHAEIVAIEAATKIIGDWRLEGCTLYSTLEPCPMCAGAILQSRLSKVVYGAQDLRWGACGTVIDIMKPGLFNHTLQVDHIKTECCSKILKDFFKNKRK